MTTQSEIVLPMLTILEFLDTRFGYLSATNRLSKIKNDVNGPSNAKKIVRIYEAVCLRKYLFTCGHWHGSNYGVKSACDLTFENLAIEDHDHTPNAI